MSQCIAGTYYTNHVHGMTPLRVFFYKLCKYLKLPVTWIFVFDGPGRPNKKNGRVVLTEMEPSWYGPCQMLIDSFGFQVHHVCY